jgi:hypothetical protein
MSAALVDTGRLPQCTILALLTNEHSFLRVGAGNVLLLELQAAHLCCCWLRFLGGRLFIE